MTKQAKQVKPVQNIILDTCLLQYIGNDNFGEPIISYLVELIGRGFELTISEISIFELLSGSTIENEKKGLETLKLFKTYKITDTVLLAASQMSTLYQREENPEGKKLISDHSISLQDKIIGATAVLTGSLVLTGDVNDFPRPFFDEVEQKHITYVKKNKNNLLFIEILSPNQTVIQERFANRR